MYIIGDVHGCYNTLMELIAKLPKDAKLCFVGDLIDRGPNSKDVVEGEHTEWMYHFTDVKGCGTLPALHFPSLKIVTQPNIEEI